MYIYIYEIKRERDIYIYIYIYVYPIFIYTEKFHGTVVTAVAVRTFSGTVV